MDMALTIHWSQETLPLGHPEKGPDIYHEKCHVKINNPNAHAFSYSVLLENHDGFFNVFWTPASSGNNSDYEY